MSDQPPPLGVSLRLMQQLLKEAEEASLTNTTDICNKIVKPKTFGRKCAYVDLLREQHPDDIKAATVFISHAWKYDLADSVDVMEQYEAKHPNSFFWFDLMLNNQHGTSDHPFDWWCTTFQQSIEQIGVVVLVMSPWNEPIPLTRSWCLFEIMCSLNAGASKVDFQIHLPSHQAASFVEGLRADYKSGMDALVVRTKVEDSTASNSTASIESDKTMIFRAV